jgi:hypothetical protein
LALNEGTATQPKFKSPVDLKVEDSENPLLVPSGWEIDFGYGRGNYGGFITVVKNDSAEQGTSTSEQPPEGKSYLEAGYLKMDYKSMPAPALPDPNEDDPKLIRSPNIFRFYQDLTTQLKVGKTYILSFKVKGANMTNGIASVIYGAGKALGSGEIISRGDRGDVKRDIRNVNETKSETVTYTGGSKWVEVKKEFTVKFDNKDMSDVPETQKVLLRFIFQLTPGSGIAQFDDLKLIEK